MITLTIQDVAPPQSRRIQMNAHLAKLTRYALQAGLAVQVTVVERGQVVHAQVEEVLENTNAPFEYLKLIRTDTGERTYDPIHISRIALYPVQVKALERHFGSLLQQEAAA